MSAPGSSRPVTLAIAAVAVLALALGLGLAARQWARPAAPAGHASAPSGDAPPLPPGHRTLAPGDTADDRAVDRALAPPLDKHAWVDEVKGADLTGFSPIQRERFVIFANAQACTCGCGYTLASCRAYDPTCPVSGPRIAALIDSVRRGLATRVEGLRRGPSPHS